MIKTTLKLAMAFAIAGLLASNASAGPVQLSNAQMDGVTAGSFVCPVLNPVVGEHNKNTFGIAGGYYSLLPGSTPQDGPRHQISVPMHATNDNGAGSPGSFVAPGEPGYSPIWYTSP
jgi:hypothetical protein